MPRFFQFILDLYSGIFFNFLNCIVYVLLYCIWDKRVVLKGLFMMYIKSMTEENFKTFYWDDRPCFINWEIAENHCSCNFGNPSGHSIAAITMYFWIFYEFLFKMKSLYGKISAIILFLLCTGMTALSRLYLGAHFMHQVIFGIIMGYMSILIYLIVDVYKVDEHILNM